MGHRSNIVLIDNDHVDIFYSQFGATSIPSDMLGGPASVCAYARSLERRSELLDPTSCEGAILLDVAKRDALFFEETGNHHFSESPGLRRALMPFIAHQWEGWSVAWAEHGWYDIAARLGLSNRRERSSHDMLDENELKARLGIVMWILGTPIGWDEYRSAAGSSPFSFYRETALTVKPVGRKSMDVVIAASISQLTSFAPARLVDLGSRAPTTPLPTEVFVNAGLFLNAETRQAWFWSGGPTDPRRVTSLPPTWNGWTLTQHYGGLPQHVRLSGRDPATVQLRRHHVITQLAEMFGFHAADMPGFMQRRVQTLIDDGATGITVNPSALDAGSPPTTTAYQDAILHLLSGR